MEKKLFDAELKVMNVIWRDGETTAKAIADELGEKVGWNVNTTYTLIKRCIDKGAVERLEPRYRVRALVTKEEVQRAETDELVDKLFDGSADKLFAALLSRKSLTPEEIARLKEIVGELA